MQCSTINRCNGQSSSNIDFFLISRKNTPQSYLSNILSQCKQDHPQIFSRHDPVLATLLIPSSDDTKRSEKYSHTFTDFIQPRVVWDGDDLDEYQTNAADVLTEFESFFPTPEFIPLKCHLYSDLLVKTYQTFK